MKLTPDDMRELSPVLDRLSARARRPIGLEMLMSQWAAFASRVEKGYSLTGYDYANDLAVRDALDEIISAASPALRGRILQDGLDDLDARFRAATREVREPIRLATPERPRWWWFRVPKDLTGELAKDLLSPS